MKKYRLMIGVALGIVAILAMGAATNYSERTIMNLIFDGTDGINVNVSNETLTSSTSNTNTIDYPQVYTHETTGTAAAGIGVGVSFVQDTAASGATNDETVMHLEAVATDVTSTSEDFDLVVKLQAAGAAAAEKFRVSSTGVVTLQNAVKQKACTIADGDATPDVTGCTVLTTSSNTGATAITDLDNPVVGAIYIIIGGSATNSSTIADSGNFALSTAFTASVDEVLALYVQADNDYVELYRSTN